MAGRAILIGVWVVCYVLIDVGLWLASGNVISGIVGMMRLLIVQIFVFQIFSI